MPTTIASNLPVFADATGHGNQSHLIYAANQQRWWCFVITSQTATNVASYVSSSNDLTSATWSAGANACPAFLNSRAMTSSDRRNLGVLGLTIGSTDAAHLSVGIGTAPSGTGYVQNIRCTFTGANTITWDAAWVEAASTYTATWDAVKGNCVAAGSSGFVHVGSLVYIDGQNPQVAISINADTGPTWTNSWDAPVAVETVTTTCDVIAFAQMSAAAAMVAVYSNGAVSAPNNTGVHYNTYASGTSWPTTGAADVGHGTSTQDQNDWVLVAVDGTHIYSIRRSGANSFDWRKFDGVSAWSTPSNGVPNQNHLAGSGLFACPDGSGNFYLFVLDSASNIPVQYVKCSGAGGATPTWGSWTQLTGAGGTARNYISGCPAVGNNQVGVIFTAVNGSNYDVAVSALSPVLPVAVTGGWEERDSPFRGRSLREPTFVIPR